MARKNKILVPEAREEMDRLKARVMKDSGYNVDENNPDDVKYEIASEQGIPLTTGNNSHLTSGEAGKIGGPIGGRMIQELVKIAQEQLIRK